jgi:hypothetical protein
MARKYSKTASAKVERAMKKRNSGTLKSGRSGKTVKSRKQAIAIGLSEARAAGAKAPKKTAKKAATTATAKKPAKKTARKTVKTTKKTAKKKSSSKRTAAKRTSATKS